MSRALVFQNGAAVEPGLLDALTGDFDIADLCLLGALSGRAGGIQVERNGSKKGLLVVADGALVHASAGELQGLAAFKQILRRKRLEFDWMPAAAVRSLEPNVRLDTSWLLKIANWRQNPEVGAPATCKAEGLLSGIRLEDLLSLLEKKRETGTITVTAAGSFGVLVLQDGQVLQADTEESHGREAIAEILSWTTLRVIYNRAATRPANDSAPLAEQLPGGGDILMADLAQLIAELADEAVEVLSAGIVRLSDGRSIVEVSKDPALASSLAACAAVVKSHQAAAELLGEGTLGETEDLLITMGKVYLLIRTLGPDHVQGLVLARSANPALARLLMRRYEPRFAEVLSSGGDPLGGFK